MDNLTDTKFVSRGHKLRIVSIAALLAQSKEALDQHEREAAQQVHMHTKSWSQDPDTIRTRYEALSETLFVLADAALNDGVRWDHIVRWSGNHFQYNKSLGELV